MPLSILFKKKEVDVTEISYIRSRWQTYCYLIQCTMKEAQENSLQSQREYFTDYIQRHPDWFFAGMYTDDGVSGLSVRNRDGFNRMVADALGGKIDMIITKSLSRFARNTVDALTSSRSLKTAGMAVYFQKENIQFCLCPCPQNMNQNLRQSRRF